MIISSMRVQIRSHLVLIAQDIVCPRPAANAHAWDFALLLEGLCALPRPRDMCLAPKVRFSILAWGNAPGSWNEESTSAESAIHLCLLFGHYSAMPQSLSKVIIHIIFSTKDREPWLDPDVRPRMHAYIAAICRDLNAEALRVGGVVDHLHAVTTL